MRASTRNRLLEAARHDFSLKGLGRATIREIVKRADANIAAVSYHFGSREELGSGLID